MKLTVEDLEGGIVKAALSGRMDLQGALAVDKEIEALSNENRLLIIDMSDVSFLASLGIRSLVTACKTVAAKSGNLVILSPQDAVRKVLATSGVDTVIPIASGLAEATAILKS